MISRMAFIVVIGVITITMLWGIVAMVWDTRRTGRALNRIRLLRGEVARYETAAEARRQDGD